MEKSYSSTKNYFPNLDGLRFIGSLIIIIFHIEGIKFRHGRETISIIRYYDSVGNFDVSLFFVLSGFLITYLLLKEKKENGSIDLKDYYVRRTLRIWPLYFLIIILGFFVLPHIDNYLGADYSGNIYKHFWLYFAGCALFLCPFVRCASGLPQTIGPIWSVGVEEVFYICWPLFLKKTRKYLWLFLGVIIVVLLVRNSFIITADSFNWKHTDNEIFRVGLSLIMQYRISCMAIGGIGAYLVVFEKRKVLALLYRKDFQWATYLITSALLLLKVGVKPILLANFPSLSYEIYSVLFAIIIVNLATNPNSIVNLNYKWMTYLGKVSYGLYMYHPIMRIFSLGLTEYLFGREVSGVAMNIVLYATTIFSTIFVAILSYEFFEKYFLKMKRRFIPAHKGGLSRLPG